jgi:serine/threonine protein phosphatase PrpC
MKILKGNSNLALFFAATVITFTTVPQLVESKEQIQQGSQQKLQQLQDNDISKQFDDKCPVYGCVLLPRDIYFDEEAQAALKALRMRAADDDESSSSSTTASDSETTMSVQQAMEMLKYLGSEDQATLTLIGYKGGSLGEQVNQDRAFVISPYKVNSGNKHISDTQLIGVFDGHAKFGERVSEYSVSTLPMILSEKLEKILEKAGDTLLEQQTDEIQNALVETFVEVDKTAPADQSGGCTASVVLQIGRWAFVANAGDSRSFIASYNKRTKEVKIEYISKEDKPHIPEERKRIESMSGQVYIPPPDKLRMGASSRVMFVDKISGRTHGLAMSRSIGDWAAGEKGVIPDPTVDVLDVVKLIRGGEQCDVSSISVGVSGNSHLDPSCPENDGEIEVFAVSATDGLLDFVTIDTIAQTVATALYIDDTLHPLSACEALITTAANEWWKAKNGRYRDDIAIAISKIKMNDTPSK